MKIKKLAVLSLTATLLMGNGLMVYAQGSETYIPEMMNQTSTVAISPFWENINSVDAYLYISNGTAEADSYVSAANKSAKISGTVVLQKNQNGSWVNVKSWSMSGTGSAFVNDTYSVTKSVSYRIKTTVKVTYNGVTENVTKYSSTVTAK